MNIWHLAPPCKHHSFCLLRKSVHVCKRIATYGHAQDSADFIKQKTPVPTKASNQPTNSISSAKSVASPLSSPHNNRDVQMERGRDACTPLRAQLEGPSGKLSDHGFLGLSPHGLTARGARSQAGGLDSKPKWRAAAESNEQQQGRQQKHPSSGGVEQLQGNGSAIPKQAQQKAYIRHSARFKSDLDMEAEVRKLRSYYFFARLVHHTTGRAGHQEKMDRKQYNSNKGVRGKLP